MFGSFYPGHHHLVSHCVLLDTRQVARWCPLLATCTAECRVLACVRALPDFWTLPRRLFRSSPDNAAARERNQMYIVHASPLRSLLPLPS